MNKVVNDMCMATNLIKPYEEKEISHREMKPIKRNDKKYNISTVFYEIQHAK